MQLYYVNVKVPVSVLTIVVWNHLAGSTDEEEVNHVTSLTDPVSLRDRGHIAKTFDFEKYEKQPGSKIHCMVFCSPILF